MDTLLIIKLIVFLLVLLDAIVVNLIAWFGQDRYRQHFPRLSAHLPLTKAWGALYMLLVAWIGLLTFWSV